MVQAVGFIICPVCALIGSVRIDDSDLSSRCLACRLFDLVEVQLCILIRSGPEAFVLDRGRYLVSVDYSAVLYRSASCVVSAVHAFLVVKRHLVDVVNFVFLEDGAGACVISLGMAHSPVDKDRVKELGEFDERRTGASCRSDDLRQLLVVSVEPESSCDTAFYFALENDVRRVLRVIHSPLRSRVRRVLNDECRDTSFAGSFIIAFLGGSSGQRVGRCRFRLFRLRLFAAACEQGCSDHGEAKKQHQKSFAFVILHFVYYLPIVFQDISIRIYSTLRGIS